MKVEKRAPKKVVKGATVVDRGPAGEKPAPPRVDAMDARKIASTEITSGGPYAQLAALGSFKGFVSTPLFDVHVEIRPGKDVGRRPPLVFLDGLDACGRHLPTDETVVLIDLAGQRYTLQRDIEKNRARSLNRDIDPQKQVDAVIATLDELGVNGPVNLLGLSYGGMIAAMTKKQHPDRVDTLMLCAPYVHSVACGDPARDMVYALTMQNPFNPLGAMMYRIAARAALAGGVVTVPPPLMFHPHLYAEALYRLSMGLEGYRLEEHITGVDKVHVLAAPADPMSPPASSMIAHKKAQSGTYTLAPPIFTMQHDLIRMAPLTVREFIERALNDPKETS